MRLLYLCCLLVLCGCDEPRPEAASEADEVAFKPVAEPVKPAEAARTITGIATLVAPDALAQIDADLNAAEIAASFSARTLARYKDTKTLPVHSIDNAERQLATDRTQLALLKLKLRNTWGDAAPFIAPEQRQKLVNELSSGATTLVRLDFPRAVDSKLANVAVTPLGGGTPTAVSTIWPAPSGSVAMPGTSFYGIMSAGPGVRPGDRAYATAESEAQAAGVVVPTSAVVVYQGASWYFVEQKPDEFVRKPITLTHPVANGYLVDDLAADTKVVIRGASVLLSREAEPVFDDDDGDDGERPAQKSKRVPVASTASPHYDPD